MNSRAMFATAGRVLNQLRHDHRTLALLLLVPCLLLGLLRWVFANQIHTFNAIGPLLLVLFPFTIMFIVTSVATLRERTQGTLERLLTMPIGKFDFLAGYAIAFGLVAIVQASLASWVAIGLLDLQVRGSMWLVVVVALADAVLGMALGLLASAFARTEFQAVQFLPAVVFPQLLLCGLIIRREDLDPALQWVSNVLPLSYAVDAIRHVTRSNEVTGAFLGDLAIVAACIVLALVLGAATLRRRTP
jgi:ABC-2 type transport system permease protein